MDINDFGCDSANSQKTDFHGAAVWRATCMEIQLKINDLGGGQRKFAENVFRLSFSMESMMYEVRNGNQRFRMEDDPSSQKMDQG